MEFLIALAIQAIIFGSLCAFVAGEKGRDQANWFVLGFLFGIFSLLALIAVPNISETSVKIGEYPYVPPPPGPLEAENMSKVLNNGTPSGGARKIVVGAVIFAMWGGIVWYAAKTAYPTKPTPPEAPQVQEQAPSPQLDAMRATHDAILAQSQTPAASDHSASPTTPTEQVNVAFSRDGQWTQLKASASLEANGNDANSARPTPVSAQEIARQRIVEFINGLMNDPQKVAEFTEKIKQETGYDSTISAKIAKAFKESIAQSRRSILYALSASHPVMGVEIENNIASVTVIVDYTLLRSPEADREAFKDTSAPSSADSPSIAKNDKPKSSWHSMSISTISDYPDYPMASDRCSQDESPADRIDLMRNAGMKPNITDTQDADGSLGKVMVSGTLYFNSGHSQAHRYYYFKHQSDCAQFLQESHATKSEPIPDKYKSTPPTTEAAPDSPTIAEPSKQISVGPSFNCAKASTQVEIMICGKTELSTLDRKMAAEYKNVLALASPDDTTRIKSEGALWRTAVSDRCDSVECLRSAYVARIGEISVQTTDKASPQSPDPQSTTAKAAPIQVPTPAPLPAHLGLGFLVKGIQGTLVVTEVKPDSPAAQVGIQPQDVLLSVNGYDVGRGMTVDQWRAHFGVPIGTEIALIVRHANGQVISVRPKIAYSHQSCRCLAF